MSKGINRIRNISKELDNEEKLSMLLDALYDSEDKALYSLLTAHRITALVERSLTYTEIFLMWTYEGKEGGEVADFYARAIVHGVFTQEDRLAEKIIREYGPDKVRSLGSDEVASSSLVLLNCIDFVGQNSRQIGGALGALLYGVSSIFHEYTKRPIVREGVFATSLFSFINFIINISKWLIVLAIVIIPLTYVEDTNTLRNIAIGDISAAAIFLAVMGYTFAERVLGIREYLISFMDNPEFFYKHNIDKLVLVSALINIILAFMSISVADEYFEASRVMVCICLCLLVFAYIQAYRKLEDLLDIATSIYMIDYLRKKKPSKQ